MKHGMKVKTSIVTLALGASLALPMLLSGAEEKAATETQTIKGEVVDLMCYLDHGAKGDKHKAAPRSASRVAARLACLPLTTSFTW